MDEEMKPIDATTDAADESVDEGTEDEVESVVVDEEAV